ncbi:MAG: ParB/RepB/Spo0J family partition protein [Phycisphaerales bacterium]|nr:ParB/RepB/Spo0J family partition protein [Phycisphaerales bacterium]
MDRIQPSPFQPRRVFEESSLEQLASSIRRSGLMQPIIVRPRADGSFELIAGERRWRAARMAGLGLVPAIVRDLDDEQAAEWGLVENIQRADLNAMERAHGLRALAERFAISHAELGERVGLDRSTVSNLIRLTELEDELQAMVGEGRLSMGHARALLAVPAGSLRLKLARAAADGEWSVREIEVRAKESLQTDLEPKVLTPPQPDAATSKRAVIVEDLERRVTSHLGTKAKIRLSAKGNRGRVTFEFFSLEHFEDLMRRIGLPEDGIG